jgi:hypothetical protein
MHFASPQVSIKDEVAQVIRDFGPVVGLRLGAGNIMGSLCRIEDILDRASLSPDRGLSSRAAYARDAVRKRESANGTDWERDNPGDFEELTTDAHGALLDLFRYVSQH